MGSGALNYMKNAIYETEDSIQFDEIENIDVKNSAKSNDYDDSNLEWLLQPQLQPTIVEKHYGISLWLLQKIRNIVLTTNCTWTTAKVVHKLILPWTQKYKCSLIELFQRDYMIKNHPLLGLNGTRAVSDCTAQVYICHTWEYNFIDLVSVVEAFYEGDISRTPYNYYMWLDIASVNHWKYTTNKFTPNSYWIRKLPLVIESIPCFACMIPTHIEPILFSRSWCQWEIFFAANAHKNKQITNNNYNNNNNNNNNNSNNNNDDGKKNGDADEKKKTTVITLGTKALSELNIALLSLKNKYWREIFCSMDFTNSNCWDPIEKQQMIIMINKFHENVNMFNYRINSHIRGIILNYIERLKESINPASPLFLPAKKKQNFELTNEKHSEKDSVVSTDDFAEREAIMNGKIARYLHDKGGLSNIVKAETMYKESLEAKTILLGKYHASTLNTCNNLAMLLLENQNLEESKTFFELALTGYKSTFGSSNLLTQSVSSNLAFVYYKLNLHLKSITLYKKILKQREKLLGKEHHVTLITVSNIALVYHKTGQIGKAEEYYKRCYESYTKKYGENDENTLYAMSKYAAMLRKKGLINDAIDIYTRIFDNRKTNLGTKHMKTKDIVHKLAMMYRNRGEIEKSAQFIIDNI